MFEAKRFSEVEGLFLSNKALNNFDSVYTRKTSLLSIPYHDTTASITCGTYGNSIWEKTSFLKFFEEGICVSRLLTCDKKMRHKAVILPQQGG